MFFSGIYRDVLVVLMIGLIMCGVWIYNRPLPQPSPIGSVSETELDAFDKRRMEHVVLHSDVLGDIGLALSLPDPKPEKDMPIIMVLGGLGTGEANIRNIRNAGNNIIVGFDWPMPVDPPKGPALLLDLPKIYNEAMVAPAQIATAIDWIASQPGADQSRISILGYSMGALAAPSAQDLTQQTGHVVRWTILAYGGAPLGTIFAADTHIKPTWMRMALAPLVNVLFHPLQPDTYLPNLTGHFLILEGKNDGLMPESARQKIRDATPDPKTVITFEGEHMGVGPGKEELLEKIMTASREWLVRMNAVNPL